MKESYYKQYEPIFGAWHMLPPCACLKRRGKS